MTETLRNPRADLTERIVRESSAERAAVHMDRNLDEISRVSCSLKRGGACKRVPKDMDFKGKIKSMVKDSKTYQKFSELHSRIESKVKKSFRNVKDVAQEMGKAARALVEGACDRPRRLSVD